MVQAVGLGDAGLAARDAWRGCMRRPGTGCHFRDGTVVTAIESAKQSGPFYRSGQGARQRRWRTWTSDNHPSLPLRTSDPRIGKF